MTKEERDKIVAEALKEKSKVKKVRRPEPQPDPIVEPAPKVEKKKPAKKEK